jgi:hypothetical protein
LLVTGLLNIALQNNTAQLFFKVYTGLFLSYFFYYYVVIQFDFDIEKLFKWYLKGCYVVALIGIFQFVSFKIGFVPGYDYTWVFNKWGFISGGNFGIRINSIFAEPTHFAGFISAAFFVAINNIIRRTRYGLNRFQSFVIITVYILSFSGLGQVGIFFTLVLILINYGLLRYVIIIIPAFIVLFNVIYNNVEEFRERLDSLVELYTTGNFVLGKTHGSSFILYNNSHVAFENFKSNFMFGSGIGSHPVAFAKYTLAGNIPVYGFNINSADANSMLLRLVSETGLFGTVLFGFILFKFYVRKNDYANSDHWLISNGILVMILLNLFRQGHYFLNGFPFFVILYFYNYQDYQKHIEKLEESRMSSLAAGNRN